MLSLERLRSDLSRLPLLVYLGLAVLVMGGLADVAAHIASTGHVADGHEHSGAELSAHLTGFVGMVLIQAGVVVDGVQRSLDRTAESREAAPKKESFHAIR
jgi:hypothetical protein